MKKEKKNIKVQIRISDREKFMINYLIELDPNFNLSQFFRNKLKEHCVGCGLHEDEFGLGMNFKIG